TMVISSLEVASGGALITSSTFPSTRSHLSLYLVLAAASLSLNAWASSSALTVGSVVPNGGSSSLSLSLSLGLPGGYSLRNVASSISPALALAPLLGRHSFAWSRPPASALGWNAAMM